MIEKQYGKVLLICDECEENSSEPYENFHTMIKAAKEEGWLIMKEDDDYKHICPECAP